MFQLLPRSRSLSPSISLSLSPAVFLSLSHTLFCECVWVCVCFKQSGGVDTPHTFRKLYVCLEHSHTQDRSACPPTKIYFCRTHTSHSPNTQTMHMHSCTHTYMHAHANTHAHTYMRACTHTPSLHTLTYKYTRTHTCTQSCNHRHIMTHTLAGTHTLMHARICESQPPLSSSLCEQNCAQLIEANFQPVSCC